MSLFCSYYTYGSIAAFGTGMKNACSEIIVTSWRRQFATSINLNFVTLYDVLFVTVNVFNVADNVHSFRIYLCDIITLGLAWKIMSWIVCVCDCVYILARFIWVGSSDCCLNNAADKLLRNWRLSTVQCDLNSEHKPDVYMCSLYEEWWNLVK